ncbi:Hypothetical predicted protein [Pelobates cultripes]|uniref:Uncharacterized protein n=1 Tax=Pelobates cultripes TaxID=61616 RepID=A0AAD1WEQ4_PELCU|nr:Hypothetical predicted protein [Pelobates cultripes]
MADEFPEQGQVLHGQKLIQPNSTDYMLQCIDRAFERFWQQLEAKTVPSQPKPHQRLRNGGDLGNPDLVGKSYQNKPDTNPQEQRATTAAAAQPRLRQQKPGTCIKRKATRAPRGTWTKMARPHLRLRPTEPSDRPPSRLKRAQRMP